MYAAKMSFVQLVHKSPDGIVTLRNMKFKFVLLQGAAVGTNPDNVTGLLALAGVKTVVEFVEFVVVFVVVEFPED